MLGTKHKTVLFLIMIINNEVLVNSDMSEMLIHQCCSNIVCVNNDLCYGSDSKHNETLPARDNIFNISEQSSYSVHAAAANQQPCNAMQYNTIQSPEN